MAIAVVATENGEDESTANFADIAVSHSFSLTNGSGNDRLVVFIYAARSLQSGDLDITSAATFNGTAATGSATFNEAGGNREIMYAAWWDDSALPATGGSYTIAFTSGNSGAAPWAAWAIAEVSGVDQTTPLSESADTAEDLTAIHTYTPGTGGDFIISCMSADDNGASDPTFTMSDTLIVAHTDSGGEEFGAAFNYATDGSISATPDLSTFNQCSFLGLAFTEAAGGTTDGALDVNSSGTVTMSGESAADSPVDISSTGTVTMSGAAGSEGDLSASSAATVTWAGEAIGESEADIDIDASAVVTMAGEASADSPVSIDATAAVTMEAAAGASADLSADSSAVVSWVGSSTQTTDAAISIDSTGTLTMEGVSDASGNLSSDGTGTVTMEGAASVDSPLTIDGTGLVTFSSEEDEEEEPTVDTTVEGGGGGWPGRDQYRRKRELRKKQDEDLMILIQMAMPEILRQIERLRV